MDQDANKSIGWEPYVGGAFVGAAFAGLGGGLFGLPLFACIAAAIEGLAIGYIVFWWSRRWQKIPNALTRILSARFAYFCIYYGLV